MKIKAAALTILAAANAMVACSSEHPIKNISLEMRSADEFVLNGRAIKSSELRNTLSALTKPGDKICITVSTAKPTPHDDVLTLMREVHDAGISCVGTVGVDS